MFYTHYIIYTLFVFSSFSDTSKEWQWVERRAWLGSRWVWLQTQVSELEYRIRALTELYTHLRQGKVFWVFMCVLGLFVLFALCDWCSSKIIDMHTHAYYYIKGTKYYFLAGLGFSKQK